MRKYLVVLEQPLNSLSPQKPTPGLQVLLSSDEWLVALLCNTVVVVFSVCFGSVVRPFVNSMEVVARSDSYEDDGTQTGTEGGLRPNLLEHHTQH